jgi:signal transduction histidine kinase
MKKRFWIVLFSMLLAGFIFAGAAAADQKEDVMALLKKGHDYIKANGFEKAAEVFPTPDFKNGELHLFAYSYDGVVRAHGSKPARVGKNLSKLKTPEGDYHILNLIKKAKSGGDWHEYRWMHPKKKKLMEKESYIMPIEGIDGFIGCGFWK